MGRQGDEYISANEIAGKAKTISYEVICALGKRAPRVFVNEGGEDAYEPRLRRVFIPDDERSIARIDSIIRSCFKARTYSPELGEAIFKEMFETLFGKENRQLELRTGFKYDITVSEYSPQEKEANPSADRYFKVTTGIEYSKTLRHKVFFIGCAVNNDQLSQMFNDESCEYRWLLGSKYDEVKEGDFKVNHVRVDEEDVSIIKAENTPRGYEVWCGGTSVENKMHTRARIKIEIETKKLKTSNIFSVFLVYPTRGLEISFNYGGTKLKNVRDITFFAGKHPYPEIERRKDESITLRIDSNDWIFPNSGVTFIWDV
jgi:alanine racemase